jgi:exopolysaccharide biosynthesis protein
MVLTVPELQQPYQDCESIHEGITYCIQDDGDIHVIIVDLYNPYLRFETVMADNVSSVDTNRRERVENMVNRATYRDETVVVAINADYFGVSHGPEGLTVKNGRRLDADHGWAENPNALWRSSLSISRLNQVSIGRKSIEELNAPRSYRERFYNSIGGGPLILNYGVVIPNEVACTIERFPIGACRRLIQTTAGLSQDKRWLYLAVGKGQDVEGFASILRDYGAFTAVKLDGGGSSQLWYDGQMRHDSNRAVGNALFILQSSTPRHDMRLISSPNFFIVEPGEPIEVPFEIQNSGFLDWEPDLGYRFKNVQGWPVVGPAYQRLTDPVPAGDTLASSWQMVAPGRPGAYATEWQLAYGTDAIGPSLWYSLIVLPSGSTQGQLRTEIKNDLAVFKDSAELEANWATLRSKLERKIWQQIETELPLAWDQKDGELAIPATTSWSWWMPLNRPLAY